MRLRNKAMSSMILGAGVYLLDALRDRLADGIDDFQDRANDGYDRARDTYNIASRRARRASAALMGEDTSIVTHAGALLLGVGVGVGVGLLLAPASGEETRRNIADKVHDMGDKVRNRASREVKAATGTYGE